MPSGRSMAMSGSHSGTLPLPPADGAEAAAAAFDSAEVPAFLAYFQRPLGFAAVSSPLIAIVF